MGVRRICVRCGYRWMQSRHGLCRACARALGDTLTTWERDRERQARCTGPAVQQVVADDPRPDRTVTIRGVEYFVTWDGT